MDQKGLSAQKRVFSKWIVLNLSQGGFSKQFPEDQLIQEFQSGELLFHLMQVLTGKQPDVKLCMSDNKLKVLEGLNGILNFIKDQGLRITLSAENIWDGDETLILGLIWILILKYQVGQKAQIQQWLRSLLEIDFRNFDTDWKDGVLFYKLVSKLSQVSDENISAVGGDDNDVMARLQFAFRIGEEKLGIKELLTAEDVLAGFLDERSCLTYLSFYYNKYGSFTDKPKDDLAPKVAELEARIAQLESDLVQRDNLLDKSQMEVQHLVKNTSKLFTQLKQQKENSTKVQKTLDELQLRIPFMQQTNRPSNVPPPAGDNVGLVISEVNNADDLWSKNSAGTAQGLSIYQEVTRSLLKEFEGFEATVDNEKFVLAFSEPTDAISFAIELQQKLNDAEWPEFLIEGEEFFRGFPVRVGVHSGPCAYLDGKYSGPAERLCNRLVGAARPGEILTSGHCLEQSTLPDDAFKKELGTFDVENTKCSVIQLFPTKLSKRIETYGKFEFLTPEEKIQVEMKEKLAKLQEDNSRLQDKLVATEELAKKARDRAMELNKFLEQSRKEMRNTIGEQVTAAMAEVTSLIKESENLQEQLNNAHQQIDGAKEVMNTMNNKIKGITDKNNQLRKEISESLREQERLIEENKRLCELLEKKHKGIFQRLLQRKQKKHEGGDLQPKTEQRTAPAPLNKSKSFQDKEKNAQKRGSSRKKLAESGGAIKPSEDFSKTDEKETAKKEVKKEVKKEESLKDKGKKDKKDTKAGSKVKEEEKKEKDQPIDDGKKEEKVDSKKDKKDTKHESKENEGKKEEKIEPIEEKEEEETKSRDNSNSQENSKPDDKENTKKEVKKEKQKRKDTKTSKVKEEEKEQPIDKGEKEEKLDSKKDKKRKSTMSEEKKEQPHEEEIEKKLESSENIQDSEPQEKNTEKSQESTPDNAGGKNKNDDFKKPKKDKKEKVRKKKE